MRFNRTLASLALVAATITAGCGKSDKTDAALQTDLSLAAQQQQAHLDSVSALEAANAAKTNTLRPAAPATTVRRSSSSPSRTASSSSRSTGSSSTGTVGTTTTTTSGGEVTVKHTQRDAAIGAAAGAVLGATTSRNKVKGGLIGAVVGGVLGGVVGNNVDKSKKKPPTE